MEKTIEKAASISDVIKLLKEIKLKHGDVEVFMPNGEEATFDSISRAVTILMPGSQEEKAVLFIRGDVALKPNMDNTKLIKE